MITVEFHHTLVFLAESWDVVGIVLLYDSDFRSIIGSVNPSAHPNPERADQRNSIRSNSWTQTSSLQLKKTACKREVDGQECNFLVR